MALFVNAEGSAYRETDDSRKIQSLLERGFSPVQNVEKPTEKPSSEKPKQDKEAPSGEIDI